MSGHFKTSLSQKPIKGFLKEKTKTIQRKQVGAIFALPLGFHLLFVCAQNVQHLTTKLEYSAVK